LIYPVSDLNRSESPNLRLIMESVVSTFDRVWDRARNVARWSRSAVSRGSPPLATGESLKGCHRPFEPVDLSRLSRQLSTGDGVEDAP
jgi:hypothetical protein